MSNKPIRLLLIEDDKVDQMAFKRFVQQENLPYDYSIAGSVAEAKTILDQTHFDIAISDYLLGDGTAFELFDFYGDTPVVFATGSGDETTAVEAMKLGAYDYLIKDPEGNYLKTLPITVALTLKRKQSEEELQNYHEHLEEMVEERTVELKNEIKERQKEEAKRRELEVQIRQKHKMEAIGLMTSGMAHNFNNNLSIILGNIELSQMKLTDESELVPLLNNAKTALLRARDLVLNILLYSRKGDHKKIAVNFHREFDKTVNLIRATMPSSIDIRKSIASNCGTTTVKADPSQIHEIMLNLCNNAVYAMNEKGTLNLGIETVAITATDIPVQFECSPGTYIKLSVGDSGSGIPEEDLEKIFDPFFTTKPVNKGTGMGLSTVLGIVQLHDGFITVDSQLGKGTTFNLFFPIIDAVANNNSETLVDFPGGTEHILFVDDELMLASLGEQMLKEVGYRVTAMTNSTKALQLFSESSESFDLVVTDQTMPQLTGQELIAELKKIRADIPTILCTGHSNVINAQLAQQLGINAFCSKPLILAELLQVVRRTLDNA